MDKLTKLLEQQKRFEKMVKPYQDAISLFNMHQDYFTAVQPVLAIRNSIHEQRSMIENYNFITSLNHHNHSILGSTLFQSNTGFGQIYDNLNWIHDFIQSPMHDYITASRDILKSFQSISGCINSFKSNNIPELNALRKSINVFERIDIQDSCVEMPVDTYENFLSLIHSESLDMPSELENTISSSINSASSKLRLPIKTFIEYLISVITIIEFIITLYGFCVPDTSSQEMLSIKTEELRIEQKQLELKKEEIEIQQRTLEQLQEVSNYLVDLRNQLSDKYQNHSEQADQESPESSLDTPIVPDEIESH